MQPPALCPTNQQDHPGAPFPFRTGETASRCMSAVSTTGHLIHRIVK